MAYTGVLALGRLCSYANSCKNNNISSNKVRRNLVSCSLDCSSSTSEQLQVDQQFTYSRACPSVRWPNLKFKDNNIHTVENLIESNEYTRAQSENKDDLAGSRKTLGSDDSVKALDYSVLDETLDFSDSEEETLGPGSEALGRHSRTRVKKMNKLALKRAKDWRQRVQYLTDRILKLQPSEPVADVLDDRRVQMTPTDFCFVVKWVGQVNWHRGLEIYEWLNLRHWYSPSPRMLATILAVLGKANQEALAEEIFNRAELEIGNVVQVYNAMMGVYARHGRFNKVQDLLNLMRSRGCEPDLVSFNTLINARAKSGFTVLGSALSLLYEVRRSGLRPDIITYNTLISACSSGSNFEEAEKVYREMVSHGCQPDLWTYNAMISVYGRSGMAKEAELLSKELVVKGFFPDAVTYNSLLYAFARDGNIGKVDWVCKDMVGAGFKPDEITYNTMIHMYGKQGRHDLAFELYKSMKLSGCNPDAVTYTVLIDSLGKADKVTEAADVLSEMLDARVVPTLRTFSALICGYAKAGMCAEAEQTFDRMLRSGIKPDHLAYSVILDVLLRSNETRKAMVFYHYMVQDGFRPDQALYQFMVKVFVKEGKNDYVEEVVRDMEVIAGMNPQAICSLLVEGECFDRAAEILKLVVTRGDELDRKSLLAILDSYCSLGRQVEAHGLLKFLKEHADGSCSLITEALITILCKTGQLEAALDEYSNIRGWGFDRSGAVYEEIILCCEKTGSFAEASQIFSDMRFYGIVPTLNCYRSAVISYSQLGFPETAHHLVDFAEKSRILFDDSSVYVTLIEAYGELKLWQRAESVVGRLRLSSTVDRKVWNALIYAYAASGLYEQGRAVFNRMLKHGPSPTLESINGLMQALVTAGRLDELYVVVEELQDMGFKISKSTILLMLDAFARAGNIFEVKKIYHGMKAAGYLPTMHLYRSMIGLFARGKRVREVELVAAEMVESGFKPDIIIFNSMLRLYTEVGDFRKTAEVYQAIQKAGYKPDADTYNILISMYSKDLRPEEALSLLREMGKQGLELKLDSYKSLLSACGRQKLWEQAEDLFEAMQSKGCKMDRTVYHIMMKIFRNSGDHVKAENILVLMQKAGIEPTVATMHMLMGSYGTGGQPLGAENVLNNLKKSGLDIGTVPYASVIDAYLKHGDYNLGIEMLLQMKRDGVEPDCRIWTCFVRAASLCQQTSEALMLLHSLRDTGFHLPIRLLSEKAEHLVPEVDLFLEKIRSGEEDAAFVFVNALEDLLWAFERRATASWVFQMAIRKSIYRYDVFRVADKDWGADFRKLSAGAALVGLTLWLDHMQDASLQGLPESPKSVVLITGTSEYNMVSLNRTLKAYLWEMGSPFLPCKTRTGLLIAKAHSLRMWLKDSAFCMDLELRDAHSLPELNSMQLNKGCFMRAGLVPIFKDVHERLGQVTPKKFARLALLSEEKRDKAIRADIQGRKAKLEKMKRRGGISRAKKLMKFGRRKIIKRRDHSQQSVLN